MGITRLTTDVVPHSSLWGTPQIPSPETLHAKRNDDVGLGAAGPISIVPPRFVLARFFAPPLPSSHSQAATLEAPPPSILGTRPSPTTTETTLNCAESAAASPTFRGLNPTPYDDTLWVKRLYETYTGLRGRKEDATVEGAEIEETVWVDSPITPKFIALIESLAVSDEERFQLVSSHNYFRDDRWGNLFNEKSRFEKVIEILSHFVEVGTYYKLTRQTLSDVVRKIGGRYDEEDWRSCREIGAGYPGYREYAAYMTLAQALGLTPEQMNQLFSNPLLDSVSLILDLLQKGYEWNDIQAFITQHGLTSLESYESTKTNPRCTPEIFAAAKRNAELLAELNSTPWTTEGIKRYLTREATVSEKALQDGIALIKKLEDLEEDNTAQIERARRLAALCIDPSVTEGLSTAIDLLNKHTGWPSENKIAFLESLYRTVTDKYSSESSDDKRERLKIFNLAVRGLVSALPQDAQTGQKILELAALSRNYRYSDVDPTKLDTLFYRNLAVRAVKKAHPEHFEADKTILFPADKIIEMAADRGYMNLDNDFISLFNRLVPDLHARRSLSPYRYSSLSSEYLEFYLAVMEQTDLSIEERERLLEEIHRTLSQKHGPNSPTLFSPGAKITPEIAKRFVASQRQRPVSKR